MSTVDQSATTSASADFWEGFRAGIPIFVASSPFALLFGALAVQNGLTVFEATLMSAAVYGGASQMVGIELFGQKLPAWLIVLSIFAVNFRHILYSATAGRLTSFWKGWQMALGFFVLTDPQYAAVEQRAENGRKTSFIWYVGMGTPIYFMWVLVTYLGAAFGNRLPDTHAFGIDYLLPLYFLGLVMGFRKRPLWLPIVVTSGVVSVVAFHYVGSPWHISIGAAAGILLAAVMAPSTPQPPHDPEPDDIGDGP
ncbi:MAG: AzlC family ABC transporter permease [Mesorhizobium sp.]